MQVGYKHGGEKLHFQIKCRDGKVKPIVKSTLKHPLQGLQPRRQRQSFRWPPSLQGEGLTEWLAILTNAGENTPSPPVNAAGREKRRCKREIVFEPSQEVQAEAKFWGYFAMSPSLMRAHWRLPFQVHARTRMCTCAGYHGAADRSDGAPYSEEAIAAHCGRASTKERLREDCGKATKDERVFDMEHFLPADPVIPIQPPLSLSPRNLNREPGLGWRITNDSQVFLAWRGAKLSGKWTRSSPLTWMSSWGE